MKDYEILQKADRDIEFAQSYINYAKNSQDTHYKMAEYLLDSALLIKKIFEEKIDKNVICDEYYGYVAAFYVLGETGIHSVEEDGAYKVEKLLNYYKDTQYAIFAFDSGVC